MADQLTIDVDASTLLAQLDRLDDAIGERLKAVARVTAEAVRDEARARLARQTAGTGKTAEAFTIDEIPGGYRVYVGEVSGRARNVPYWLEEGTVKMRKRPFMRDAARLEEGPHMRRVAAAVQDALDEVAR
jgi:hypothetical protein